MKSKEISAAEYFAIMPDLLEPLREALPAFRKFCKNSKWDICRSHLFVGSVLDTLSCDKKSECFWIELDFGKGGMRVVYLPYSLLEL